MASMPAWSARKRARGMWKPWVTTTARRTPKMSRARTMSARCRSRHDPRRCPVAAPRGAPAPSAWCPARRSSTAHDRRRRGFLHLPGVPEPGRLLHPVPQHPAHLPVRPHQRPRHDRHFGLRHVSHRRSRVAAVREHVDVGDTTSNATTADPTRTTSKAAATAAADRSTCAPSPRTAQNANNLRTASTPTSAGCRG